MANFLHLLITRYNAGLYSRAEQFEMVGKEQSWMEHRFPFFCNYCLPSVVNQTNQEFLWLVMMDYETPPEELCRVIKLLPSNAAMICCKDPVVPGQVRHSHAYYFMEPIKRFSPHTVDWIITSRVDNDDCIAGDYIERIQSHPGLFRDGAVFDVDEMYRLDTRLGHDTLLPSRIQPRETATPFITLAEDMREKSVPSTCYFMTHSTIRRDGDAYEQIPGLASCFVVHDRNWSDHGIGNIKDKYTRSDIDWLAERFNIEREDLDATLDAREISEVAK
jgi:hypothetical protein